MDIYAITGQLATLFLLLAAGYICNKISLLDAQSNKLLTKLVLGFTMPCLILNSVTGSVSVTGGETLFFMLMCIPAFLIFFALAIPLSKALGGDKSDHGLYAYLIALGNAAFMGFPVAQSVFGDESAFFVALFNIPFTLVAFSVGILLISKGRGKINPRVLINPSLITALAALILFFTGFKLPDIIADSIKLAGSMTTPSAMLVIGSTLAELPFRDMFSSRRLYLVTFFRLILVPIVTWLALRFFITNELMLGVLVLLSAMPSATTATMLATQYGGNERLASKGIFLTTLFSVITIPLIVLLLF